MPENPSRVGRRAWGWMVGALVLVFVLMAGLAMCSEREDARRLPPEELERRGEEPWRPEPLDSPALPNP